MSKFHSMGFMVMQDEECLICKKSIRSMSRNSETYFCRVCEDVRGKICPSCREADNLVCPKCGMPLRQKEDPVYKAGGMY